MLTAAALALTKSKIVLLKSLKWQKIPFSNLLSSGTVISVELGVARSTNKWHHKLSTETEVLISYFCHVIYAFFYIYAMFSSVTFLCCFTHDDTYLQLALLKD